MAAVNFWSNEKERIFALFRAMRKRWVYEIFILNFASQADVYARGIDETEMTRLEFETSKIRCKWMRRIFRQRIKQSLNLPSYSADYAFRFSSTSLNRGTLMIA